MKVMREIREDQDKDDGEGAVSGVRQIQTSRDLLKETILPEHIIQNVVDVLHRACRH